MCGRTVCTLSKEQIQKACGRKQPETGNYEPLEWKDVSNGGKTYAPSYNICPTDVTPVIVADSDGKRIIQPMMWGIIPPWHKGSYKSHGLSTNNCRIETITKSNLFKTPLQRGNRCVVLCDGFYEWQTTKGKNKQPYFIYSPQPEGIKIDDAETWVLDCDGDSAWSGPHLLYMAAIFNSWTSPEGEEFLTYSVITMESDSNFSWLHHRIPGILDNEDKLSVWLNHTEVDHTKALAILTPGVNLKWHPVSSDVNNSRNKTAGLNRALVETKSKSANMMMSWLKRDKKSDEDTKEEPESKKQRMSNN